MIDKGMSKSAALEEWVNFGESALEDYYTEQPALEEMNEQMKQFKKEYDAQMELDDDINSQLGKLDKEDKKNKKLTAKTSLLKKFNRANTTDITKADKLKFQKFSKDFSKITKVSAKLSAVNKITDVAKKINSPKKINSVKDKAIKAIKTGVKVGGVVGLIGSLFAVTKMGDSTLKDTKKKILSEKKYAETGGYP